MYLKMRIFWKKSC